MPAHHTTEKPLAPELETIAAAAADQLRAHADANTADHDELKRRVADAASAAIADAERSGQQRARDELGADALRRVARATRRRRDAEIEYDQEVLRADRLGPAHREIAAAAAVAHATVRTIVTRAHPPAQ